MDLPNAFTVTADSHVDEIRYRVGASDGTARRVAPGTFEFQPRVGTLAAGSHELVVTALSSGIEHGTFTGSVEVIDTLAFTLEARPQGNNGPFLAVETLRLIDGVGQTTEGRPFNLAFRGSVESFNLRHVYEDRLAVWFVNSDTGRIFDQTAIPIDDDFRFGKASRLISNTVTDPDEFDYSVHVGPREGFEICSLETRLSNSERIRVIELPEWMGTPDSTAFDLARREYVLDLKRVHFSEGFGASTATPFGMWDGLDTQAGLTVDLQVLADLTASRAVIESKRAYVDLTVLGKSIISNSGLPNVPVTVGSTLNATTLALGSESVAISIDEVDLLQLAGIDRRLIDVEFPRSTGASENEYHSWFVPVPYFPAVGAKLGLRGALGVDASRLTASATAQVDFATPGDPRLIGGSLQIDAEARGRGTVAAFIAGVIDVGEFSFEAASLHASG